MKVAFCASEVFPFAKTGGLADVCGALPIALKTLGVDVRIFLPAYRGLIEQSGARNVGGGLSQTTLPGDIPVYLVEHEGYFDREFFYGDDRGDYPDNFDRFLYFSKQILEGCRNLGFRPDVVHCNDWQTAMIPVLLKYKYGRTPEWAVTKSVLTVHNMAFQGVFPSEQSVKIGLDPDAPREALLMYDRLNFLKAGLLAADGVNTVSQQYARDARTAEFGCGLQEIVAALQPPMRGILNGIDDQSWHAATDPFLDQNFSAVNVSAAKDVNKEALQLELDLPVDARVPLFGFVGRLSHQKGMDILREALPQLLALNVQVVLQGLGDKQHESAFADLAARFRDQLVFAPDYNERLAHRIYAASDFFLMPSVFEPCGLTQMISMAYATLPVVHWVGGLCDTVKGYTEHGREANGFGFHGLTTRNFVRTLEGALAVYQNPSDLDALRRNALATDFSWTRPAEEYRKFYECLLSG